MLLSGLVFIGWVFSTLVSAFSLVLRMDVGSVCYLVGNFSGVLVDVATPSLAEWPPRRVNLFAGVTSVRLPML